MVEQLAGMVLLISSPDILAVRSLEPRLQYLRRLSIGEDRLRVVLNRTSRSASLSASHIESYLKLPVVAAFAEDPSSGWDFCEMGRIPQAARLRAEAGRLAERIGLSPASRPGGRRS